MPRRYRPRHRKTAKKPSLKKAKRVVAKSKVRRAKKGMDTFFLRAKANYVITPSQGVTVANYVYGTTQLLGGNLFENAEFQFYRLQYDKFRVNTVRLKWTPKANVLDQARAQNDSAFTLSGDGMIHTVIDRDGVAPSSTALLSRYPSYKQFSVMKKWKRQYTVTYPTGVWIDCQDPTMSNSDAIANTLGLRGCVTYYAENLVEDATEVINEPIANLEIEFDIVFQGKTSSKMSWIIGENGQPTSVTIDSAETLPNKVPTPLRNIRGTIHDTLLVDTPETGVVEVPVADEGPL